MQWRQSHGGPEFIDPLGIAQFPGTGAAVAWIIEPLRTISLWTAFVHRDPVFQISRMPRRNAPGGRTFVEQAQDVLLKIRFSDRVLGDDPCRFGAVLSGNILCGPTMLGDYLAKPDGIFDVDRFHAGNVRSAKFSGIEQFLAHAQIFRAHGEQFVAETLIDHRWIIGQR